jgi:hypothetical protein
MRWEDELYVRVYTSDSPTWKLWSWETRVLLLLLLRKVDRAGLLELGDHDPIEAIAATVELPIELRGTALVIPNYIEAQTASKTDAQRKREGRMRARALVRASEISRSSSDSNPTESENGTTPSGSVTAGHSDLDLISAGISHTRAREDASPPGPSHPPPRFDLRKLSSIWTHTTQQIAVATGLDQVLELVEQAAPLQSPPVPVDEYATRCVRAFVEWIDSIPEGRRPQKSPLKFREHFSRIQEIVAGKRAAVPVEEPPPNGRFSSHPGHEPRRKRKSADAALAAAGITEEPKP